MPFALLLAQATGIAQRSEFIASVLVVTSIVPIQIYLNEVFAPRAVRYQWGIDARHVLEVGVGALLLSAWAAYRLELAMAPSICVCVFAQGYIWCSYAASRMILKYQADLVIGGRYSYILGSVIPLTFLLLVALYWGMERFGFDYGAVLYLLILLPNALQYFYVRWFEVPKSDRVTAAAPANTRNQIGAIFFPMAMFMAIVAQHWKVELVESAEGFAALSVYLIVPFSSAWLILSKSRYLTREHMGESSLLFWLAPVVVGLTLFLTADDFVWAFPLALVTQVLTFKFITDLRTRASVGL